MKTLDKVHLGAVQRFIQVAHDLKAEATSARLFGSSYFPSVLEAAADKLIVAAEECSQGPIIFTGVLGLLNAANFIAEGLETQAMKFADDQEGLMWARQAYAIRRNTEALATELMHASGKVPKFEATLASLRLTCAASARFLGLQDESMTYVQGTLRLAAPESTVESVKGLMQAHRRM